MGKRKNGGVLLFITLLELAVIQQALANYPPPHTDSSLPLPPPPYAAEEQTCKSLPPLKLQTSPPSHHRKWPPILATALGLCLPIFFCKISDKEPKKLRKKYTQYKETLCKQALGPQEQGKEELETIVTAIVKTHSPEINKLKHDISKALTHLQDFNAKEWRKSADKTFDILESTAKESDEVGKNVSISRIVGAGAGTAGGVVGLAAAAAALTGPAAPVTFVVAAVFGGVVGLLGGLTSAGAQYVGSWLDAANIAVSDKQVRLYIEESEDLQNRLVSLKDLMRELSKHCEKIKEEVISNIGQKYDPKNFHSDEIRRIVLQNICTGTRNTRKSLYQIGKNAGSLVETARIGADIARLSKTVIFGDGFRQLVSRSVVGCATASKALCTGVLGVVGVGLSIYEIIQAAQALGGSEVAKKLRERKRKLEEWKVELETALEVATENGNLVAQT